MGELLDAAARGAVLQAMRDCTPADVGHRGVLWTHASMTALIKLVCRVSMTEQGVGKWLRRHGFTPQRPARRCYRQQDVQVRARLEEEYPCSAASRPGKLTRAKVGYCTARARRPSSGGHYSAERLERGQSEGERVRIQVLTAIAAAGPR
ncbi:MULTISPECIES: winged helix-turn-helix domain-containing protein [unclassified Streptomyces]|uniref:winged helix-turn-helix domain-containing protein n=1 Tax=unclassified Streptomyces TaxID=2593676 RepID=UPI0038275683